MRGLAAALWLAPAAAVAATLVPPPVLSPPDTWLPRTSAQVRVLDKVNATSTTLTIPVGGSASSQTLSIAVLACMARPPDLPRDATARLHIADSRPGAPGFAGWMFADEPGLAVLENPVYDVTLVGCT